MKSPRSAGATALGFTVIVALASPVDGWAEDLCRTTRHTQAYETMMVCVSSYLQSSKGDDYTVRSLTDDNHFTTWCEGAPGSGHGEHITVRLENAAPIKGIWLSNGDGRSEDHFLRNARAKIMRIELISYDPGEPKLEFVARANDRPGEEFIPMEREVRDPRWLRINFDVNQPGRQFDDLCVNGLSVDFGL